MQTTLRFIDHKYQIEVTRVTENVSPIIVPHVGNRWYYEDGKNDTQIFVVTDVLHKLGDNQLEITIRLERQQW
jgi:hypothetical protein